MSSKIYICDGLSHCQWCSKDIYRGSKMLRFDGFSSSNKNEYDCLVKYLY